MRTFASASLKNTMSCASFAMCISFSATTFASAIFSAFAANNRVFRAYVRQQQSRARERERAVWSSAAGGELLWSIRIL